jgi:hypothetical protein
MSRENRSGGKIAERSFTLLVGLFSLVLVLLGLVANPASPVATVHGKGGLPFYLGMTLVGGLGVLVHAALRAQQRKIQTLESELVQIRLLREI